MIFSIIGTALKMPIIKLALPIPFLVFYAADDSIGMDPLDWDVTLLMSSMIQLQHKMLNTNRNYLPRGFLHLVCTHWAFLSKTAFVNGKIYCVDLFYFRFHFKKACICMNWSMLYTVYRNTKNGRDSTKLYNNISIIRTIEVSLNVGGPMLRIFQFRNIAWDTRLLHETKNELSKFWKENHCSTCFIA